MGGDDELGTPEHQTMQMRQDRQLTLRRQRSLGLVEQIASASLDPMFHQSEEGLPMGALVEGSAPVVIERPGTPLPLAKLDLAGHVVETLSPEEPPLPEVATTLKGEIPV
ncbi:MAG: hypothetical protein RLZ45_2174 [Verrucomicrobiota bacterium]